MERGPGDTAAQPPSEGQREGVGSQAQHSSEVQSQAPRSAPGCSGPPPSRLLFSYWLLAVIPQTLQTSPLPAPPGLGPQVKERGVPGGKAWTGQVVTTWYLSCH